MILGDFNAPLTPMNRSSKQKINRETQVLNDTLENMALIDILGHSIQMQKNIPFLKSTWNILRIEDPILGHKSDLGEFKKIEIISSNFSDHNTMSSVQFSSVAQSCLTLCDLMNCSMPDRPVHHLLLELTQTPAHRVSDAIQPSHLLSSPSPPTPHPSQHQGLFQ